MIYLFDERFLRYASIVRVSALSSILDCYPTEQFTFICFRDAAYTYFHALILVYKYLYYASNSVQHRKLYTFQFHDFVITVTISQT